MNISRKMVFYAVLLAAICVASVAYAAKYRRPFDGTASVANFMDHDTSAKCKIYSCTTGCAFGAGKTYDGHGGTDFMVKVETPVLAGASGTFWTRNDGCPNTGSWSNTCGYGFGNNVRIKHSDRNYSIYAHLKSGSPINGSKDVTKITCGMQIGLSACSGKCSGPHIHFELRTAPTSASSAFDPYGGDCSGSSYWMSLSGNLPSTTCESAVNPKVSVNPLSGTTDTTLQQPGTGFTPNGSVSLYFEKPDGSKYDPVQKTANSGGTYSNAYKITTTTPRGTFRYWAVDKSTGKQSNVVSYKIY